MTLLTTDAINELIFELGRVTNISLGEGQEMFPRLVNDMLSTSALADIYSADRWGIISRISPYGGIQVRVTQNGPREDHLMIALTAARPLEIGYIATEKRRKQVEKLLADTSLTYLGLLEAIARALHWSVADGANRDDNIRLLMEHRGDNPIVNHLGSKFSIETNLRELAGGLCA